MADERLVWMAGSLTPVSEARIPALSPSCQYGINVFETVRCYWCEDQKKLLAFRLMDHIQRLFLSAKVMRLNPKQTLDQIQNVLLDTVTANGFREDVAVRIVLYVDQEGSWTRPYDAETLISPVAMGRAFGPKPGIACCTSTWERIHDRAMPPRVKGGANYVNSRMAQLEATANGFDSALLLSRDGKVSEGVGSCLFIVRQGKLVTPSITSSILESITRETVLTSAEQDLGLPVSERDVDRTELYICDEAFLCGTSVEITPVLSVDRLPVGNGEVGAVTAQIGERYFDIVRGKVDAYRAHILPVPAG